MGPQEPPLVSLSWGLLGGLQPLRNADEGGLGPAGDAAAHGGRATRVRGFLGDVGAPKTPRGGSGHGHLGPLEGRCASSPHPDCLPQIVAVQGLPAPDQTQPPRRHQSGRVPSEPHCAASSGCSRLGFRLFPTPAGLFGLGPGVLRLAVPSSNETVLWVWLLSFRQGNCKRPSKSLLGEGVWGLLG